MSAPVRVVPEGGSAIASMIAAVAIEIEAVRRRSRADILVVTNGARTAQEGAGATYRFTCATSRIPREEDRVVGDFDGQRVNGCIVSRRERSLTVALEADLGPEIERGRIMVDRTFLWTTLRDRLEQLQQAPGPLNVRNIDILTGRRAPTVAFRAPVAPLDGEVRLNAEQELGLRQALGSDVSLGWGPPGTGKTVVCQRLIVDGFYAASLSTLVTAPTNRAVDVLLARVLRRLKERGELAQALAAGHVVRVGPFSDPDLQREYGPVISLDAMVASEKRSIREQQERLAEAEARANANLLALQRGADVAPGEIEHDSGATAVADRWVAVAELRRRLDQLDRRAKSVREDILNRARIVATTVHRAYMPKQVERMFDAVVLDEGGFTNLPAACCAAARARAHVVVMGDFRQLGPITESDDTRVAEWVGSDVYHASGVVTALERDGRVPGLFALRVQHRSDPAIAALANAVTYKHSPLVTHPDTRARPPLPSPWGTAPLMIVDTSPLRSFVRRPARGDSRYNPVHAAITRWLIEELARFSCVSAQRDGAPRVVVLSPFREQVRLLRRHLPRALFAGAIDVSTVHRYQGDEAATVILDMVDARGLPCLSRLLQAKDLAATGARLVNVAVTRARQRLIVVMDMKYLLRETRSGPVHDFVSYLARHATRIALPPAHARQVLTYVQRWEGRRGRS